MGKYRVRYYREERSHVRCDIEVSADSPEEARARVEAWGKGELELTADEEVTDVTGKEELVDSGFLELEAENDPYAVVEVPDLVAQGKQILPLLEGGDLLRYSDIEEKLGFDPRQALHQLFQEGSVAEIRAGGMVFWSKHDSADMTAKAGSAPGDSE